MVRKVKFKPIQNGARETIEHNLSRRMLGEMVSNATLWSRSMKNYKKSRVSRNQKIIGDFNQSCLGAMEAGETELKFFSLLEVFINKYSFFVR